VREKGGGEMLFNQEMQKVEKERVECYVVRGTQISEAGSR